MQVTPSRLEFLNETLQGLKSTGAPLVALHNGNLVPAAQTDDIGPSYVIPQLAAHFNLTIPQAIDVFYYGLISCCLLVGLIGALFLYKRPVERALAFLGLVLIALLSSRVGDVYVFAPCAAMALLPWLAYSLRCPDRRRLLFFVFGISGFAVGWFHIMRAHSGSAVLIFGILGLIRLRASVRDRLLALILAGVLAIVPIIFLKYVITQRDRYIHTRNPSYEFALNRHPFWHSVYIGLGFVYNPYVSGYRDEVGEATVKAIDPSVKYVSTDYERLLKHEVLKIHSPTFWINNFGAKIGVIVTYLVIFGNIGLLLRMVRKIPFEFDLPFLGALAFSCLPGILVVPYRGYLLGFIALAVFYNFGYCNHVLACGYRSGVEDASPAPERDELRPKPELQ